jgi:A/G-specific adenine glycosylase
VVGLAALDPPYCSLGGDDMTRDSELPLPDAAWLRAFRRRLRAWYARNARDLPWRRSRDPYAVWLSEVMLQQTQVETVRPYFERFLRELPTIAALAAAAEHQVLRLWEGLGYYRRAQQLHRAARLIQSEHTGRFPQDPAAVRRLPGIGRYTAGAILSIAFDQRQPILEANTARLWSRLLAFDSDQASPAAERLLWAAAEAVLPQRGPGRFNQALMELGSQVCRPRLPECAACPVATLCRARLGGRQAEIPLRSPKPPAEAVREAAAVVSRRGRVLLVQWPEGRRWAGLWDFPRFAVRGRRPADIDRELVENVRRLTGATVRPGPHLKTLRHGVTRFRITLDCYAAEYLSGRHLPREHLPIRWLRPVELQGYPLSSTGRKLAGLLAGEQRGTGTAVVIQTGGDL